ncbi:MAG TPA: anti-sigma factor [Burkholderiaceae bacterium]|nr:anti-sigma factor [Burkholderiaceae bacterium]
MNCHSVEPLLSAYVDGEVAAYRSWLVARHLRACTSCAAKHQGLLTLRARVRTELPRFHAPAQLQARVRALAADAPAGVPTRLNSQRERWRWLTAGALAGCAATLIALVATNAVLAWRMKQDLALEVVALHVRATLGDHLIEVASSDQHTVKPWLSARLDYSPPVPDLASAGFTLVGARLEAIQGQTVATLVYRYRQHSIDVFVRPESAHSLSAPRTLRGFHIAHASGSAMDWLAVSDVSADVLTAFVTQLAQAGAAQ